jgi:hypothetical protein
MNASEEQKIKLAESGLIELPYVPLPEPVHFVTEKFELRITIVPMRVQVVQGRRFRSPGISAWFRNGSYSTRDPRIVKFLRWDSERIRNLGGTPMYSEVPGRASVQAAQEVQRRLAAISDKIAEEVEKEMGPIPKKERDRHIAAAKRRADQKASIRLSGPKHGAKVVDHASSAHEQVFDRALRDMFDTSIFQEANEMEPVEKPGESALGAIMGEAEGIPIPEEEEIYTDGEPQDVTFGGEPMIDDEPDGKVDKIDLGVDPVDPGELVEEEPDESGGTTIQEERDD